MYIRININCMVDLEFVHFEPNSTKFWQYDWTYSWVGSIGLYGDVFEP